MLHPHRFALETHDLYRISFVELLSYELCISVREKNKMKIKIWHENKWVGVFSPRVTSFVNYSHQLYVSFYLHTPSSYSLHHLTRMVLLPWFLFECCTNQMKLKTIILTDLITILEMNRQVRNKWFDWQFCAPINVISRLLWG